MCGETLTEKYINKMSVYKVILTVRVVYYKMTGWLLYLRWGREDESLRIEIDSEMVTSTSQSQNTNKLANSHKTLSWLSRTFQPFEAEFFEQRLGTNLAKYFALISFA